MPRKRGFTLVELLVVIGIIALLISILLPSLSKARKSADAIKCAANLRAMGQALTLYVNETRYYPGCHGGLAGGSMPKDAFNAWAPRLRNAMSGRGGQGAFLCPSAEESFAWKPNIPGLIIATTAHEGWGYEIGEPVLQESKFQFSYGYNDWGTKIQNPPLGLGGDLWPGHMAGGGEVVASLVVRASEMIVITDVVAKPPVAGSWLTNVDPRDPTQCPSNRHDGGSNVLFADGHVVRMLQSALILFDPKSGNSALPTSGNTDSIASQWNNDGLPHYP